MADRRVAPLACGLVALAALAGCGVPAASSGAAAGPALAPVPGSPTRTVPAGTTPATPTGTGSSGTVSGTPSRTPTATTGATPTAVPTIGDLVADTIGFGPPTSSVGFERPASWSKRRLSTPDGTALRNRTVYSSDDGRFAATVEISPATTTTPYSSASALARSNRRTGRNAYRELSVAGGPGDGATWEFLYTDPSTGVRRHALDHFATVGATDLALLVTAPVDDWPQARALWRTMVASVRPGAVPPDWSGPVDPSAAPSPTGFPSQTAAPAPSGEPSPATSGSPSPATSDGPTASPSSRTRPTFRLGSTATSTTGVTSTTRTTRTGRARATATAAASGDPTEHQG